MIPFSDQKAQYRFVVYVARHSKEEIPTAIHCLLPRHPKTAFAVWGCAKGTFPTWDAAALHVVKLRKGLGPSERDQEANIGDIVSACSAVAV